MYEENVYFEITESGNSIRIELIKYSHSNTEMDWDANWVRGFVKVKGGKFTGEFCAELMTIDFVNFKNELGKLYEKLNGIATFKTLESQVEITIIGDGIGHLIAKCKVMDKAGIGNKLEFEIDFDQTHIPKILNQLENINDKYPVIGDFK